MASENGNKHVRASSETARTGSGQDQGKALQLPYRTVLFRLDQAKSAILFLYKEVLEMKLPWLENVTRAKMKKACIVAGL